MAPFTCRNTLEDVGVWHCDMSKQRLHVPVPGADVIPTGAADEAKKQALGTDKGKDTKVGGKEVCLSWHLGFFGWMWQPLCCLMSPRHGWRIVCVSGAFGIVDTTLQHKVELMFADSCDCHTVVRENPRQGEERGGEKERESSCCNKGLELAALCFPSSEGSLKCHLELEHQWIRRLSALQNFELHY